MSMPSWTTERSIAQRQPKKIRKTQSRWIGENLKLSGGGLEKYVAAGSHPHIVATSV